MDKKDSPNHEENKIFFFVSPLHILQINYPQNLKIQKTKDDIVHKSFLEQKIHTFCIRPPPQNLFPHFHITNTKKWHFIFFSQFLNSPDV